MVSDLETLGGAAVAASRLADGLLGLGHEVTRVVVTADGKEHAWKTLRAPNASPPGLAGVALRRLTPARRLRLSDERAAAGRLRDLVAALRPDAVNLHNLHWAAMPDAYWSTDLAEVCAGLAPTVWTLHDMWSFTGRCAYSYDCRKFITGCDAECPTATEYPVLAPELIAGEWQRRRRLFAARAGLAAVTPSRWLAAEARAGLWSDHRVEVIPNGLPLDTYLPLDRSLAREALGIEARGPVLLAAAQSLTVRRKGGDLLTEALRLVSHRPFTVVTLGDGDLRPEADGIDIHPLGYIDHERTKVLAYSAADLFVHPAPVDNLPNVVLEAIACGTPTAALPVGGVPDMVRPGQTGWLAEEVSAAALARAIDDALGSLAGHDWRGSCRATAVAEYGLELQAQRYLQLFASLME